MNAIVLILLIVAAVLFVLAAFGVGGARVNLIALGLASWVSAVIVQTIP